MRVAFSTLGCKVNHYETQAMEELFAKAGHDVVPFSSHADVYIVNTCTVTQMSDKKSRQLLTRAHAQNPSALIVAAGCYPAVAADEVAALKGVSLVIGNRDKPHIVRYCEQALSGQTNEESGDKSQTPSKTPCADETSRSGDWGEGELGAKTHHSQNEDEQTGIASGETSGAKKSQVPFFDLSATHDSRTRAMLKIQDGCNRFCSYCIIPFARGNLSSRSMESCEKELSALVSAGYKEVVLAGIQLCAYRDGERDLLDVIRLSDALGVPRLRLGSLEPTFITDEAVELLSKSRSLCRHFHLSLQSGSDSVLQRMNRRYTTDAFRSAVQKLRDAMPDCAVTTDIICGFAGETTAEHEASLSFVREIGFSRIHVFPYSRRAGTKAATFPGQLPKSVKAARTREFLELGEELETAFIMRQKGTIHRVLMESDGTGYTENYVRVRVDGADGELITVEITGQEGTLATGRRIDQ
ncbi:MAG: tRNA (N(6)-L-threonylcarbamoyladenosine(37)-C(2))-methylthiotransferase MtaB [Clostridia bacterium]|nr:tRNA (N(6)-L-threonylcarbamoyladenosine(37)-C(2))-methylthiotransferase MtaB [Clostridia bacterium]